MPSITGRGFIGVTPYKITKKELKSFEEIFLKNKYDDEKKPSTGFSGIPNMDGLSKIEIKERGLKKVYIGIVALTLIFSAFVSIYDRFIYKIPEPEKPPISDVNIISHNITRINESLESYTLIINNSGLATGRDVELSIEF